MTDKDTLSAASRAALDRYKASQTPSDNARNDALASVQERILSADIDVPWDRQGPAGGAGDGGAGDGGAGGGGAGGGGAGGGAAGDTAKWLALGGAALLLVGGALLSYRADEPPAGDATRRPIPVAQGSNAPLLAPGTPETAPAQTREDRLDEGVHEPAPPPPKAKRATAVPTANERASESPDRREPTSTLREEMKLLSRGQDALNAGNHAAALAAFDEHRSRFPSGSLATERELKRIATLCRMGRTAEARAAGNRMASQRPGSPSGEKAQRICAESP